MARDLHAASEAQSASRFLHRLGETAALAGASLVVGAAVLVWAGVGLAYGFPDWWQTVLESVSASLTLIMVFTIQHTQTRQQAATQRKLDELLRSQPEARNRLIAVEHASPGELDELARSDRDDRSRAHSGDREVQPDADVPGRRPAV